MTTLPLPSVVDHATWTQQVEALRVQEKSITHQLDAVAAARRRLPMVPVTDVTVEGDEGKLKLSDVFQGRSQLIVYSHMWVREDEWKCHGCGNFTSQVSPAVKFLANYDARLVVFADAPYHEVEAYKEKIGYQVPMYSVFGTDYMTECSDPSRNSFAINVFLRDGDKVYRTWCTSFRGIEMAGYNHHLLDMLPYGRREEWQDLPEGWPKTASTENWPTSQEIAENLKGGKGG